MGKNNDWTDEHSYWKKRSNPEKHKKNKGNKLKDEEVNTAKRKLVELDAFTREQRKVYVSERLAESRKRGKRDVNAEVKEENTEEPEEPKEEVEALKKTNQRKKKWRQR